MSDNSDWRDDYFNFVLEEDVDWFDVDDEDKLAQGPSWWTQELDQKYVEQRRVGDDE